MHYFCKFEKMDSRKMSRQMCKKMSTQFAVDVTNRLTTSLSGKK